MRTNNSIRAREVRVIEENGGSLGIMETKDALKAADDRGADLVEISPNAKPPVCKIMDYGKYKFEQTKKEKQSKKKQHTIVVKEIQIRPNIDKHDLTTKLNHALEFLEKGYKVKFVVRFRGREMEYKKERSEEMLQTVLKYVSDKGELENDPVSEHRTMIFHVASRKK